MPVAVDLDEPFPGLIIVGERHVRVPCRADHGREVHQDGITEHLGGAGFPAEIVRLAGQFLGFGEVPDRAPVVDQIGGGPKRVHVVDAQVVAAPLEHMLALLQCVPAMTGLAQRSSEPFARLQPADVLPTAGRLKRGLDPPCHVE